MTLFNLSRYIAKQVTDEKLNRDMKVFVVGPAGSGKSMTGLKLATSIARWVSFYNHYNDGYDHANEYFTFDKDHIAVINTKDLLHVMTKRLPKNSIKVIDDCGATRGFTSRRAMSNENLDIVSIYGTNRVQNGVAIFCVQDESFTDIRMRVLADITINLDNWYQEGPFRIARLRKIRKDKSNKMNRKMIVKECRFMTYQHGEWVVHDTIACELPEVELKEKYDLLRLEKEKENSDLINRKYSKILEQDEIETEKPHCPYCNSTQLYYSEKNRITKCKGCGRRV